MSPDSHDSAVNGDRSASHASEAWRRAPQTTLDALDEFLAARPSVDPVLAAAARRLAASIDAQPDTGMAQLVKEFRAAYKELKDGSDTADPFASLLSEMGDAS